jgi:activator of 2-hydroxyglutaryl-CoA dehydratase
MIHPEQGEPLANIVAGLHGERGELREHHRRHRAPGAPVLFIGGAAPNPLQVRAFLEAPVCRRITPLGAIGAALASQRAGWAVTVDFSCSQAAGRRRVPGPLLGRRFDRHPPAPRRIRGLAAGLAGIDIGSTTTKFALVDGQGRLLAKRYVPTRGRPIEVARDLVAGLCADLGGGVRLLGLATTGSGRQVVGDFLAADLVIDEITAHARGAIAADPEVDTIFEIGGQDAVHRLKRGRFRHEQACAAGTGSFLHELAAKLGVDIAGEFETVALASKAPVQLAERCTVFMESDLVSALQRGAPRDDLIAGLAYAVVRNYLNRVSAGASASG